LLKSIQNNYKTYILSNTNAIHYRKYIQQFREEYGFDFVSLFTNTYWSFQFGKRKPDTDPFIHLMNLEKIKPEETLFIDDTIQNIRVARNLNIFAIHLTPDMDVSTLFKDGYLKEDLLDKLINERDI
jgi:putative hydrolase of the HAD superfamily